MSNKVTFQLDTSSAGRLILQNLAVDIVDKAANAIASRAQSMASNMTTEGITFGTNSRIGRIKVGERAIATVAPIDANDRHRAYLAYIALLKAKDAGRVN
jgi:hypothetical protein